MSRLCTATRPKVFLSHSTKDDSNAAELREHLETALKDRGWDVLVDEDGLKGGDEWRGVLYEWIAVCDAAIVLMTDKALASSWVRREINLLLWRRALGTPLMIIPAMVAPTMDTGEPELRDLKKLQFEPNKGTPEEFASKIAERLPDVTAEFTNPVCNMRRWISDVLACLREVTEQEMLEAAATELDAHYEDRKFTSVLAGQQFLAHWLLGPTCTSKLPAAMKAIARGMSVKLEGLISLVVPVWVDGSSARALLPTGNQVCATLNANKPNTAKQYVRRAACCSLDYHIEVLDVVVGENLQADLLRDCEQAVRTLLDLQEPWPIEGVSPVDDEVCFLVIHPNGSPLGPVAAVVRTVLDRYPWLNVVLLTEEAVADKSLLDAWQLTEGIVLPALAPGAELLADQMTMRLRRLIKDIAS
ncbi:toll/interleukin-1 receptor domain-containing protein [Lentzea alba]|uniref:toll/interleukin-1 receptor domain-containing protein n=1 Tax=Lentzea alba TaxID=2714351 RepID=UPI0039BF306E